MRCHVHGYPRRVIGPRGSWPVSENSNFGRRVRSTRLAVRPRVLSFVAIHSRELDSRSCFRIPIIGIFLIKIFRRAMTDNVSDNVNYEQSDLESRDSNGDSVPRTPGDRARDD